jgi:hypothetical protein
MIIPPEVGCLWSWAHLGYITNDDKIQVGHPMKQSDFIPAIPLLNSKRFILLNTSRKRLYVTLASDIEKVAGHSVAWRR